MSQLTLTRACKRFGEVPVVDGISLSVTRGTLLTLLGPSGCGKSTLLRCIAGLERLDSGQIVLDGRDITRDIPQQRQIAMVFQHYALFPNMTVAQNIEFGLKVRKLPADLRAEKVRAVLEMVELLPFAAKKPASLSGGQKQRVALARGLVMEPKLLLLDEPLSALDARIRKSLRSQIRDIQRELSLTTLFVTHDQEEALAISDEIVLLNHGRIEQHTNPDTLYSRPNSRFGAGFIGHYNLDLPRSLSGGRSAAVRPEAVEISLHPHGLPAVIRGRTLLGNVVRYRIDTDCGHTLDADVLNHGTLSGLGCGSRIHIHIPDNAVIRLEEQHPVGAGAT